MLESFLIAYQGNRLKGKLWIVEPGRIREHQTEEDAPDEDARLVQPPATDSLMPLRQSPFAMGSLTDLRKWVPLPRDLRAAM